MSTIPDTCAGCGNAFDFTIDSFTNRPVDLPTESYPYCRACHYRGVAWDVQHADVLDALHSRGLRTEWWMTGGGCWMLVIQRDSQPEGFDEVREGEFIPYVGATVAERDDSGEWYIEAYLPETGEPWSACYYPHADAWGAVGQDEPPSALPLDVNQLAAFALKHLPEGGAS